MIVSEQLNRRELAHSKLCVGDQSLLLPTLGVSFRFAAAVRRSPFRLPSHHFRRLLSCTALVNDSLH